MVTVYVLHQHSSAGSLWIPGPRSPQGLVGVNQALLSHSMLFMLEFVICMYI